MKFLLTFIVVVFIIVVVKNLTVPASTGVVDGKLHSCPNTPNCFSTTISATSGDVLQNIETYLLANYKTNIVKRTPVYLHAVVSTSGFHFKDDLEFLLDKETLSIRSAARVGYSDFGTNRDRIEQLRIYLIKNGDLKNGK